MLFEPFALFDRFVSLVTRSRIKLTRNYCVFAPKSRPHASVTPALRGKDNRVKTADNM